MKKFKIIVLKRIQLIMATWLILISLFISVSLFLFLANRSANISIDNNSGIIVIDPGHGGIDGGSNTNNIFEKDINLEISKILKVLLEQKGYKIILTREEDISLDSLNNSSSSRHQRDLNARADIINSSNAQLFLSIHVNSNFKKPSTDGSIVFYSSKYQQNKILAYCIQRSLNSMIINGKKRTIHDPQQANYFILNYSQVPGVIIETAFISNTEERTMLTKQEFREQLAMSIADGLERYFTEQNNVFSQ